MKAGGTAFQWNADHQIEFWVFSNGRNVIRFWMEGLTEQQAGQSRALFTERQRLAGYGRLAWVREILDEVVMADLTPVDEADRFETRSTLQ